MRNIRHFLNSLVVSVLLVVIVLSPSLALGATTATVVTSTKQATSSASLYYVNSSGVKVKRPVAVKEVIPVGATAQCRDNSYSFSQHRRGTCSHHGGVRKWL
jgi:hypothetical protein